MCRFKVTYATLSSPSDEVHEAFDAAVERVEATLAGGMDELFVPFVTLAEVASLDDALAEANKVEYGLTAGIFSEDQEEIATFFDRVEAGVARTPNRGAERQQAPGLA